MNICLEGKNILITGGARGLGKACAQTLSQSDGRIAIADIDFEEAKKASSQIKNARAYHCDFGNPDNLVELHRQILADMETGIDILINNAGIISYSKEIETIENAEWTRLIDVNLSGAFYACREFVQDMKVKGYGKIVNMSSMAARAGGIDVGVHYTVSKAGIIGLTKDLAKKLGPFGINVNAVAPGIMLTEPVKRQISGKETEYISKIPLGRLGNTEDVANVVLFLSSHLSDYITGCVLDVNGGMYMG